MTDFFATSGSLTAGDAALGVFVFADSLGGVEFATGGELVAGEAPQPKQSNA
jgi:hypothetical protein